MEMKRLGRDLFDVRSDIAEAVSDVRQRVVGGFLLIGPFWASQTMMWRHKWPR